jgi:hypothetical protein
MEHDPFIDDVHDVPVKMVIFHGYGSTWIEAIWTMDSLGRCKMPSQWLLHPWGRCTEAGGDGFGHRD